MKKKNYIVLCMLIMMILSACGAKTEVEEQSQLTDDENKTEVSVTEYEKEIYDGEYVTIVCNSIYNDRIEFSVKSKLENNTVSVLADTVALDGKVPKEYYGGEDNWLDIEPGNTALIKYYAYINYTNHSKMTACFEVFNDEGAGVESIDVVNFDLGEKENQEYEEPKGTLVYDSQTLGILYAGADDTGIRLRISNKMPVSTTIVIDRPFTINGKEYDEHATAMTIPADAITDYYFYVKQFDADYTPNKIESFSCSGRTYANEEFMISSDKSVQSVNIEDNQKTMNEEKFVAKGETGLFVFLENASDNGYELRHPERDGNYVEVEAHGNDNIFDITYMVIDQHIYQVCINNVTTESKYLDCIYAMAKSLNPDIEEDVFVNAVESAFSSEKEEIVVENMLFKFNKEEKSFTLAY